MKQPTLPTVRGGNPAMGRKIPTEKRHLGLRAQHAMVTPKVKIKYVQDGEDGPHI